VSLIKHGREFRMRSRWMLIFSGTRSAYRKARGAIGRGGVGGGATPIGGDHVHSDADPVHMHASEEGVALAVADDLPVSEWHHGHHGRPGHHHHKHPEPDAFMNYGKGTAFVVGMVHGIGAETPTQVLIFLTAVTTGDVFDFSKNNFGGNFGGGFFAGGRSLTVRADWRYFRAFNFDNGIDLDVIDDTLGYWRGTVGVGIMW